MDFYEVVRKRRSIRKYGPQPVEAAMLDRILDAGTRGPTGGYSQGQSYVLITDPPLVQRLMDERDRQELELLGTQERPTDRSEYNAPVLIVACTKEADYRRNKPELPWPVPYWYVDSGCGIMLILLAAINEGLAACLIDCPILDVAPWREMLGMPEEVTPVGTILIGYRAADEQKVDLRSKRRSWEDCVHRQRW